MITVVKDLSPHALQTLDCSQQPLLPCRGMEPFQPYSHTAQKLSARSLLTPHLEGVYFHMHLLHIEGTPNKKKLSKERFDTLMKLETWRKKKVFAK
jgi:hypothetical protein